MDFIILKTEKDVNKLMTWVQKGYPNKYIENNFEIYTSMNPRIVWQLECAII